MIDKKILISILEQHKLNNEQAEELQKVIYGFDDGRLLDLPCKIGDTVYAYCDVFCRPLAYKIEQIYINHGGNPPSKVFCHIIFEANCYDNENDEMLADIEFEPSDIGKTVFLTEEQALKEFEL
ncbi:MAG: hypothetical protein J1E41_01650 [Ruminococcus sp.]|nr:hypothetical protein [Ruminococcus sp.]